MMKLIRVFLLPLFMLLLFNVAQAQTNGGKISGIVLDDTKKPLDGATVILLAAKDSSVVSTQLVNRMVASYLKT